MTVLLIISVAALVSGIFLTAQALNTSQVSLASNEETATVTAVTTTANDTTTIPPTELNFTGPPFGMFMMGEGRGRGPCGFGIGRGDIEVSSDYIANVTAIAKADTDVQTLLSSGYNITRVVPQIKMTVDGNGNVALKATNATLLLVNGTTGRALVNVDLSNNKVTEIVNFTRTVITKP